MEAAIKNAKLKMQKVNIEYSIDTFLRTQSVSDGLACAKKKPVAYALGSQESMKTEGANSLVSFQVKLRKL